MLNNLFHLAYPRFIIGSTVLSGFLFSGCGTDLVGPDIATEQFRTEFSVARVSWNTDTSIYAKLYHQDSSVYESLELSNQVSEKLYVSINGLESLMSFQTDFLLNYAYYSTWVAVTSPDDQIDIIFDRSKYPSVTSSIILPPYPVINSPVNNSSFTDDDTIIVDWNMLQGAGYGFDIVYRNRCSLAVNDNVSYLSNGTISLDDIGRFNLIIAEIIPDSLTPDSVANCELELDFFTIFTTDISDDGYASGSTFKAHMGISQTHTILLNQ